MPFQIIRNDITKVKADAIVNTANPEPRYAGGTDYAVYEAAGKEELLAARKKIGTIAPGEAVATPAFRLPAKYIIHTVGPVWIDGKHGEMELLASCYRKSLLLAEQLGLKSIAFPLMASGVNGFPKDKALSVAMQEIAAFLNGSEVRQTEEKEAETGQDSRGSEADNGTEGRDMEVKLVVFNREAFELSETLVKDVRQFIDDSYAEERADWEYRTGGFSRYLDERRQLLQGRLNAIFHRSEHPSASGPAPDAYPSASGPAPDVHSSGKAGPAPSRRDRKPREKAPRKEKLREEDLLEDDLQEAAYFCEEPLAAAIAPSFDRMDAPESFKGRKLEDLVRNLGETFQQRLLRLIDERGMKDPDVYKRANVDRKLFSKIRCNPDYTPKKKTALALAIALGLNLDETKDLLGRAGFALSPGSTADMIVTYCIIHQIFDIYEVNALLFQFGQSTIGA